MKGQLRWNGKLCGRALSMKRHPTAFELRVKTFLDAHNIIYKTQKVLCHCYIVDFLLPDNVVVEVDGPLHDRSYENHKDKRRQAFLEARGFRFIRIHWKRMNNLAELLAEFMTSP